MFRLTMRTVIVLLACFAAVPAATAATPPEKVAAKHAQVELLSRQSSVNPGRQLLLGVHFVLEPGWHIYWVNPGDSGQPPAFQWQLPAGFTAGEIQWPRPQRMQNTPALADYGYHDDVLLLVPVRAPPFINTNSGAQIGLLGFAVDAKWLICREVCLSDRAQLHLSLPEGPDAKENPATAALFAAAEKLLPKPWPANWKATARWGKENCVLSLETGKTLSQAVFFPLDPDQIDNAAQQKLQPAPRGVKITLKKSDLLLKPVTILRGVLVVPGGNAYHVDVPVSAGKE